MQCEAGGRQTETSSHRFLEPGVLTFKQVEFPVRVKQSLPIGWVLVQSLPPLLEEEVTVSTDVLFLFSGQPGPAGGRASGVVLLQE
jgi:hypothetical protein